MTGNETTPSGKPGEEGEETSTPEDFSRGSLVTEHLWPQRPDRQQGASAPSASVNEQTQVTQAVAWLGSQLCSVSNTEESSSPSRHPGCLQTVRSHLLLPPRSSPPSTRSRDHTPEPESSSSSLSKSSLWQPGIINNCRAAQGKYLLTPDG